MSGFCILLVLGLASLAAGHFTPAEALASQPNIIVILSDDAGYNEFGFTNALTGYPTTHAVTPNLDALAAQSVVARQGYVASPLCNPSRAGLLTGQHPQRFGREDNLPNVITNPFGLNAGQQLISHHLKDLGYTTGAIGKWHLGFEEGVNRPLDQGFDEFYGFLGGSRNYYYDTQLANRMRRGNADIENIWKTEGDSSKYDPSGGRYVTDAFGEEAVDFINRHANDEDPFFLYVSFSAPHTPWAVKQSDYNHVSHIENTTERTLAAMNYAMDRSVGDMMNALATHGIDDNTIVVFMNDNGGPTFGGHFNQPFYGFKGYTFEGGIRVPFFIKMPGVAPGVYDNPIVAYDLMPTLVAAAGGDTSQLDTAGVDLAPFLSGEDDGRPHELMFWRNRTFWAVRKGDWKLCRPNEPQFNFYALYDLANDPYETVNRLNTQPEIAADLYREFTYWEATLQKPESANLGTDNRNRFDHFVFRNDQAASANWDAAGIWRQAGTVDNKTMLTDDAYANAILEFTTRNDANYSANNNMTRMSGLTFMLNQVRLTGAFSGGVNRSGAIGGNALLLVNNLDGQAPTLHLDATSSGTDARFGFNLSNELQLLDDLEIAGDGTQDFVISGRIVDYYEPRSVTKHGTSRLTLTGNNSFQGNLAVQSGSVRITGPNGAVSQAQEIVVGSEGTLLLDGGSVTVNKLDNSSGGTFDFTGGRLTVVNVEGDLTNNGGTYAPGASPALSTVSGDYVQTAGALEIEIGGTGPGMLYDQLQVGGAAVLQGALQVLLSGGYMPGAGTMWEILTASSGIHGVFDSTVFPALDGGLDWTIVYGANNVTLSVGTVLTGDFNGDGIVDAADYTVWRDGLGTQYNQSQYHDWKNNFGAVASNPAIGSGSTSVPEPATGASLIILFVMAAAMLRNRSAIVARA